MEVKQTSRLGYLFRLLRFALHVLQGVSTIALVFPFVSRQRQIGLTRRWAAGILAIFNVKVSIKGEAPAADAPRVIFVANHISWLDPALIIALRPAHFVAKAEIRSWPVLGWLAAKAGTLFIERGRRHDTARMSGELAAALNAGECVGLFPEATTTDGTMLKPFHSSLFQAAVAAQAVLYPVAIRYHHPDGSLDTAPAYTDSLRFAASLQRVLRRPEIHAELVFAPPIPAEGQTRHELARRAQQVIASALNLAGPDS